MTSLFHTLLKLSSVRVYSKRNTPFGFNKIHNIQDPLEYLATYKKILLLYTIRKFRSAAPASFLFCLEAHRMRIDPIDNSDLEFQNVSQRTAVSSKRRIITDFIESLFRTVPSKTDNEF